MNIAGVPEHFNFPFVILSEKRPKHFQFITCPGGSGEMASLLLQSQKQENLGEREIVDLAVMLPEAAYTFIDQNPDFKIFGEYTNTAITWGVYVKADSDFQKWEDIQGKRFGISRQGSGSELMAYYAYHNSEWDFNDLKFRVVQNLQGARRAFNNDEIDVFLWEVLTTQTLVESNEWRQIGTVQGDWPGFVFVGHQQTFFENQITYPSFFEELKWCIREYSRNAEDWAPLVAKRFQLTQLKEQDDLVKGIEAIEFSEDGQIHEDKYKTLQEVLKNCGKIGNSGQNISPFH